MMGIEFKEEYSGNGIQDELDEKEPRSQGRGKDVGKQTSFPKPQSTGGSLEGWWGGASR